MTTRRWVLHVDMDQFLVAVELLRRPELAGRPVIVGGRGDATERAVVSTASYEARERGVRSGLALKIAVRRCPEAVLLPVDFPVYEAASAEVMATLREHQAAVLGRTRLHCSVGIGDTLVRAKIATDFGKPQGTYFLHRDNWLDVMGHRPTTALWGVGNKIDQRLAAIGLDTVAQLAASPDEPLIEAFGPNTGPHFGRLGRGEGRSWPDDTPWVARAHGRETTFQVDLSTRDEVAAALRELAERVIEDLTKEGRAATRVHLKVRFAPFFTHTKVRKLAGPTMDPAVVADTALTLFGALADERPVRLLGVRAEMVAPEGGY